MTVVYEDNHIVVVNKTSSEIVQGDKTGDTPLSEMVKQYLKEKYNKPGNVFIGVTHRLDRPVSGLVEKDLLGHSERMPQGNGGRAGSLFGA